VGKGPLTTVNSLFATRVRTILSVLAFGLLGIAGNYFKLTLFFDVDLIFGSIVSLIVLQLAGLPAALAVSAIASSYTYILWNHPYAVVIMVAEVAFVGWFYTSQGRAKSGAAHRANIALLDTLYWLVAGMPLVFIFYHLVMGLDITDTLLVMFKQSTNGILNSVLASLLFSLYSYVRWKQSDFRPEHTRALRHLLFSLTVALVIVPTLVVITVASSFERTRIDQELQAKLGVAAGSISQSVEILYGNYTERLIGVRHAYAEGVSLSGLLNSMLAGDHSILAVGLLDAEGNIITAADAPGVPVNLTTASGDTLSALPGFTAARNTGRTQLRQLNPAEISGTDYSMGETLLCLIISIGNTEPPTAYSYAIFSGGRLHSVLEHATAGSELEASLIGPMGRLLLSTGTSLSTNPARSVGTGERTGGSVRQVGNGIYLWEAPARENISVMQRWRTSVYFTRSEISGTNGWTILVAGPVAPYQARLYTTYRNNLFLLLLIIVAVVVISDLTSRRITRSLARFGTVTSNLPDQLGSGRTIQWPHSFIHEVATLIDNFRATTAELENTFHELVLARNRAEEANRAKSAFLTNISHDIRTPLNSILGMARLLSEEEGDPLRKEYLNSIQESANVLLRLLNDIIDLSRIESSRLTIESADFNISEVLEDTITIFRPQAQLKNLKLVPRVKPDVPSRLRGDSKRLRQILMNLVGNAVKFTSRGEVEIHVTVPAETDRQEETLLRFDVQDTGPGIPPDKQERIFESFTQADSTVSRQFGGSGLGLTISKELVQLMGGNITLESRVGEGSTFSFTIPFGEPHSAPAVPGRRSEARGNGPSGTRKAETIRILAAEDDRVGRIILDHTFGKSGVRSQIAENGKEALDLLSGARFDLVLLDLHMPVIDGNEAARRIRNGEAGEHHRTIPILAMTAFISDEDRQKSLNAGITTFVSKPLSPDELSRAIETYVSS